MGETIAHHPMLTESILGLAERTVLPGFSMKAARAGR